LLVAPLLEGGRSRNIGQWAIIAALSAGLALNAYRLIPEATESDRMVKRATQDLARLPAGTIVTWAEAFPYEFAYPVLADTRESRNVRIFSIEPWTYAPFMLAAAEEKAGRGAIERLRGSEGMELVAPARMDASAGRLLPPAPRRQLRVLADRRIRIHGSPARALSRLTPKPEET
jgi:hypothetical protein